MRPSDFYVSILNFFAILVPGAVGVAVLEPLIGDAVLGIGPTLPSYSAASWVAFLIAAYFLGHLIFLAGSGIDPIYGSIRDRYNPRRNEAAYRCAERIRDGLVDEEEKGAVNPYQWSRAVLVTLFPAAAEDVHRLEADSKFFRSLLVVFILAASVFFYQHKYVEGSASIILVGLCFLRYAERRLKTTTQVYHYVIALHRLGKLDTSSKGRTAVAAQ